MSGSSKKRKPRKPAERGPIVHDKDPARDLPKWYKLICRCPACAARGIKTPQARKSSQWFHADCDYPDPKMEVSDFAALRCSKCFYEAPIVDWRWGHPGHDSRDRDSGASRDGPFEYWDASPDQIAVIIALSNNLSQHYTGQKWILRFMRALRNQQENKFA